MKDIFTKYETTIDTIQIGFFGSWGEMHSTSMCTQENFNKVIDAMLENTPDDITISVRTPSQLLGYAQFVNETDKEISNINEFITTNNQKTYRLGIYDDGYLGSSSDLGTYKDRETELKFLENQTTHTSFGGEAVINYDEDAKIDGYTYMNKYSEMSYLEKEALRTHTDYLNYEWNQNLHNDWKSRNYNGTDEKYKNVTKTDGTVYTDYDYINSHLGYRYVLKNENINEQDKKLKTNISIENVGFSPIKKNKIFTVIITDKNDNEIYRENVDSVNVKDFTSKQTIDKSLEITLPENIQNGKYKEYIQISSGTLENGEAYLPIQFANENMWNDILKANYIGDFSISQATSVKLYTLPSVDNMSLVGTNRGNWHDRQDLGIYMQENSAFEARIQNYNEFKQEMALDVLNDDSQTEKEYRLKPDGTWVKIEASVASVPFMKTAYNSNVEPIIEIRNQVNTKELIKYMQGGDEEKFFTNWRNSGDKFAVIEGKSLTMLVPVKNIEDIVHKNASVYQFKTIDEMLKYYDDFTAQYDNFLGLEYNATDHLNNNVKTKYFVKANKHGAGAAYYTGNHTAQNGDNISGYLSRGWLNLHEFGHGYQGIIANQELALGEVTNNVLGYYFQQTFLPAGDNGWMGSKQAIENNMKTARDKATKFNDMNERQKLYVLVNVLDKLGPEKTWATMNKDYRKLRSEGKSISTSDLFATEFSKQGYNVIPYLNENKIFPSDSAKSEVYEQNIPMIFYLRDLVSTDEESTKIKTDLNLKSDYDLVSTEDLKKYNLNGNLKITFDMDNIDEIKGKKAYLKDGKNTIKEFEITDKEVELKDIPIGIYYLEVPMANGVYSHEYENVIVKENTDNEKTVKYTKSNDNVMASDTAISFQGLGNSEFAKLNIDMNNKKINFIANNMQPHSYFSDEYANIKIYDSNGKIIYEKSFIGNKSLGAINDSIDVDYGYKISIKHREAESRLKFNSKILNEQDTYLETKDRNGYTTYVIGKNGLEKEGQAQEENYNNYKQNLDKYISNIRGSLFPEDIKNQYKYFKEKFNILSMINGLNKMDMEAYKAANKDILGIEEPAKPDDDKKEDNPKKDDDHKKDDNKNEVENNTIDTNIVDNNTIANDVTNNIVDNNTIENNVTNNTVDNNTIENDATNNIVNNNTIENNTANNTIENNTTQNNINENTANDENNNINKDNTNVPNSNNSSNSNLNDVNINSMNQNNSNKLKQNNTKSNKSQIEKQQNSINIDDTINKQNRMPYTGVDNVFRFILAMLIASIILFMIIPGIIRISKM